MQLKRHAALTILVATAFFASSYGYLKRALTFAEIFSDLLNTTAKSASALNKSQEIVEMQLADTNGQHSRSELAHSALAGAFQNVVTQHQRGEGFRTLIMLRLNTLNA